MEKFNEKEIKIIHKYYPKLGKKMSYLLPNHPTTAIQNKAKKLGIYKLCCPVEKFNILRDDAIYLAAIIDGEGTIGIWERTGRMNAFNPQIAVYNTNFKLIKWIQSVLPPIPYRLHIDNRGVKRHKIAYNIAIRGMGPTYTLLKVLMPHFKVKNEQAELLFEFDEARIMRPIRQQNSARDYEIYKRLREINAKGAMV